MMVMIKVMPIPTLSTVRLEKTNREKVSHFDDWWLESSGGGDDDGGRGVRRGCDVQRRRRGAPLCMEVPTSSAVC